MREAKPKNNVAADINRVSLKLSDHTDDDSKKIRLPVPAFLLLGLCKYPLRFLRNLFALLVIHLAEQLRNFSTELEAASPTAFRRRRLKSLMCFFNGVGRLPGGVL